MTIHEQFATKVRKPSRKTKMEILEAIKSYIESEDPLVFNKSSMVNDPWNLDPRTVDEFLEIAYFCQNSFPRIRISTKNGKKAFQQLDYQELKREIENFSLKRIDKVNKPFNFQQPKVYPVFKCRECGFELGYPTHHNESMNHYRKTEELYCNTRGCDFSQQVPEHHNKRMEIYVKYTNRNQQKDEDWLHEEKADN